MIRLMPGEVDAVLLGQPLHLTEQRHVPRAVAAPAAGRPPGADQAQPVVLPQGLRVHAGQLARPPRSRRRRRRRRRPRGVLAPARSTRLGVIRLPACTAAVICGRGSSFISSAVLDHLALRRGQPDRAPRPRGSPAGRRLPLPGTPVPRTRSVRPLGVPGGTFSVTVPSRVGTGSVVPSTASANGDRHGQREVVALAAEQRVPATWTTTNRSPAGPPRWPGAPLPASRIRWPSRRRPGCVR